MKEKKFKKWQIALIAIVVLGVVGAVAGGSDSDKEKGDTPKTTENGNQETGKEENNEPEVKAYKIGDVVVVGDVEYTVSAINATDTIGNEYLNAKAQNMYLVVDISIKNNGDKALTVADSFFKLLNDGKEYSTDSGAALYLGDDSMIFKEINPDASLSGKLVFDVAQETIDASGLQLQVQTGAWGTEKEVIHLH